MIAILLALASGTVCNASNEPIAALVRQLGDEEYARREAAARELEAHGESALPALHHAAATDDDPEIRWRAKHSLDILIARRREAAVRKDLVKLQGVWFTVSFGSSGTITPENHRDTITVEGDRYFHMLDGNLISAGQITISDATVSPKQLELSASEGQCAGCCWRSIYRVGENDLVLCYNGGNPADSNRPSAFSDQAGFLRKLKRAEKPRME